MGFRRADASYREFVVVRLRKQIGHGEAIHLMLLKGRCLKDEYWATKPSSG